MHARMAALASFALVSCAPDGHGSAGGGSSDATSTNEDASTGGIPFQPAELLDESGARFAWVCGTNPDRPDHCSVERIPDVSPPLPPCDGDEAFYAYSWGRYFSIDGACDRSEDPGYGYAMDAGRCVVCASDLDCPQLVDYDDDYECVEGYCQNVDPVKYADLPNDGCGTSTPRYGCEDTLCSSGIPE